ncbi:DUF6382 domain-containing protein [Butyrivibrio sp. YAB3001]|uniref:DUF6382 domain-containing protein n=1 Tax=Butyrivibrio sp. YAB3001 TaxID=1520812 RepID=UPI0008F644C0|nr:DUF6382 domain-containing protein [Butyrivibrio sp. YAB3001]SFC83384.1 Forkhead associated (FHA) domain, binds pSer, pThr, pTyr [Butyrivibrio sp. YAB3001]
MDYRYCRELKHNYLIVKSDEKESGNKQNYQMKIMEKSRIDSFIPFDKRVINGETFLYYRINSMQSIKDRFSARGMSKDQLIKLFSSLKQALESLEEYLLGIENVILDSKSIFMDFTKENYRFMYYPFGKTVDISKFVDELFELVDHEDEDAVELIYDLSEKSQMESFLLLDYIEQVISESQKEESVYQSMSEDYRYSQSLSEEKDFFSEQNTDFDEEQYEEKLEIRNKETKKTGVVQLIFAVLFLLLMIAMMYIRMNYILTREENSLSMIVLAVSVISGLVAFVSGIKDFLSKDDKKIVSKKTVIDDETEGIKYDYYNEIQDTDSEYINIEGYKKSVSVKPADASEIKMSNSDETVVLDIDDEEDRGITLYSSNTDKTFKIVLDKFPLTVGKLEECVDKVISDMSISRIHCRFSENSEGKITITDLNSTNGTFRNGLKLKPQEENVIEEGDEIRIGRICFDCR